MISRKVAIILGSLVSILIILVIAAALTGNGDRGKLETMIATNRRIANLSNLARDKVTSSNLQNATTSIAITSQSDTQQLIRYYESRYNTEAPKPPKEQDNSVTILEETPQGQDFENTYRTLVLSEITANQVLAQNLLVDANKQDLATLLEGILKNYEQFNQLLRN